jgi:tetratricopeptide (TPR) repeat protein
MPKEFLMPQSIENTAIVAPGGEASIEEAARALAASRLDEAERLFVLLLEADAASPEVTAAAHKGFGDVMLQRGSFAKAAESYRAALGLRSLWPEAENNLGNAFKLQGDLESAEHHYRQALAADPHFSPANNNLGVLLAEKDRLDEAADCFREAASASSSIREAQNNLATTLLQLGRLDEARAEFEGALAKDPDDPDALIGMARLLRASGEPDEALALARRALRLRPAFAEGYLEAGTAALALGDPEQALPYCRYAVEAAPNNAEAHAVLATALQDCGSPQDAEHHFQRALQLAPNQSSLFIALGRLFEQQGRFDEAEQACRAALAAEPEHAFAICQLGNLALKRKRPAEALTFFERARELQPDSASAHNNIGAALNELRQYEKAAAAYRNAIMLNPDRAEPHHNLGAVLQTLGRLDEARRCYERALELKPDMVPNILSLSTLAANAARELLPTIEALLRSDKLADEAKAQLYFSQARLYDESGDYEAAFAAAVAGNAIDGRRQRYEPAMFEQLVAGIEETFTAEFFSNRRFWGARAERPIFVVGMPRAGTTLIEQVLASHPQVFGGGELPFLPHLAADLRRWSRTARAFPHGIADLHEPEVLRLAGAYRRATRALAGPTRRVTDKMLANLFYIGLVALLFPAAKIVYCRRTPFDLFISGYFMLFRNPVPHTTDQSSFAHFYRLQERLLAHWRRVSPIAIHEIQYERLIADQVGQTRALLEYCELEWDPRCLDFYLTNRPVRTGSDTQVRRPLYRSSVDRARPYMNYLGELERALTSPTAVGQQSSG